MNKILKIASLAFILCFGLVLTSLAQEGAPTDSFDEVMIQKASQALNPYPLMTQSIYAVKMFVININAKVADATKGLFLAIAGIYFVIIGLKYYANSQVNPMQQLVVLLGFIFCYSIVYGGNFEKYIYEPSVETTKNLSAFVLETSSGGKVGNDDSIKSAMEIVTGQISQIYTINDRLTDQAQEAGLTDIGTGLYSWFLKIILMLVYTCLIVVFFTIYTVGLIGMHFILFFFPWAMLIGAFPFGRGVLINWFKSLISFGLVPVFASVAMGVTIFTLSDIAPRIAENMQGATTVDISSKVYQQALLIGLFSIFFHLKASEFAQTLTGSQVTNFGQFFGSVMGVGAAGWKGASLMARSGIGAGRGIYGTAGPAYNNMRDAFGSTSRAVQSYLNRGK